MDITTCPECETGTLSIVDAQTEQTIVPGYFIRGTSRRETRLRDCTVAACNACEFCYEITAKGLIGYPLQES